MKSKLRNHVTFAQTVEVLDAMNTILNIQEFAIQLYEDEGMETAAAHEEANKLVFSRHFYALTGHTVAQWVALGGPEKKAIEVVKDLISEAVKESHKEDEQKIIMAKVFRK